MPKQQCECGARFKFAESSLGKRAKCKRCGTILTLTGEEDLGPIPFADEDFPSTDAPSPGEGGYATPPMPQQGQLVAPPGSPAAVEEGAHFQASTSTAAAGPRTYVGNVLWTFLFPGASAGNLVIFIMIWVAMVLAPIVRMFPLLGWFLGLLVVAWYAALRFTILVSAAAGESELPDIPLARDLVEDLLVPIFKWVVSWIVVFIPAFAYLLFSWWQGSPAGLDLGRIASGGMQGLWEATSGSTAVFVALLCLGPALWPIVVLCVALGGVESLYRVDFIVLTIVRTFPAYILTLVLMFGAIVLLMVLGTASAVGSGATGAQAPAGSISGSILTHILTVGLSVYLDIVLMRLIGLYYHHFKRKFAFAWG